MRNMSRHTLFMALETPRARSVMPAIAESARPHRSTPSLASEQVQAVDKMNHAIAVDSIVFGILTHGCRYGTADIALTAQDIVELHTDRSRISLQEIL